ncbi:MAG: RNA methyltransferase [Deltaproteobacteria bacterium]|nr:RNA methyltransferase [Deltaproteobacteria bacterium]
MKLDDYLTESRRARIAQVLAARTRDLLLVLEGVHDPHNVAACMRTAEGLGLQEVHVVAPGAYHPHHKVVQGADKWLDIHTHRDPAELAGALRPRGYLLYAAALVPAAAEIASLDFTRRVALVLGNEHDGVSREMMDACDGAFVIPMRGFTRSFNVSVAAGIALYHATRAREAVLGPGGTLGEADREALRAAWVERSVRRGALLREELEERDRST